MVERPAMAAAAEASNLVSQQHSAPTCDQAAPTSSGSSDPAPSVKAAVPDCVLRAIYPERYAAEPNSQSRFPASMCEWIIHRNALALPAALIQPRGSTQIDML